VNSPQQASIPPAFFDSTVIFPSFIGLHQTNSLTATFDCFGNLGYNLSPMGSFYPFRITASFETPPGSGVDYLYGGSLLIGGIIGPDTLVSAGFSNFAYHRDFYPSGYPNIPNQGMVTPVYSPYDKSFRCDFDDTLITTLNPRQPLNIKVISFSHSFQGSQADQCIIYDVILKNFGTQTITQGYLGIYLDADINHRIQYPLGYQDDFAGSIRKLGIGYMIDNDGDPNDSAFQPGISPLNAIALKFLGSSFIPRDTTFNWWSKSPSSAQFFEPISKKNQLGTPVSITDEYKIMSTPEWDYDQVMISTITPSDPEWMYPDDTNIVKSISHGGDSRIMMSIGPFELMPDSCLRFQYAIFSGNSIHTDPHIMDYLNYAPELYKMNLNFSDLRATSGIADSLARELRNPRTPILGPRASYPSPDSTIISWDPWVLSDIEGYNIYFSKVPDSICPFPGVYPPWYQPESLKIFATVDKLTTSTVIRSLEPYKTYACHIVHRLSDSIGAIGKPLFLTLPGYPPPPYTHDSIIFFSGGNPITVQWEYQDTSQIDHFNVYKFTDSIEAKGFFKPFFSTFHSNDPLPHDSIFVHDTLYYYYAITPYRQVPKSEFSIDADDVDDNNIFQISAVHANGVESAISNKITVYKLPPRIKDVLVFTNSIGLVNKIKADSVFSFYNQMLAGLDYTIFNVADTLNPNHCSGGDFITCTNWRDFLPYRLIIIDDGLKDGILSNTYEQEVGGFAKYLKSGGSIAYFGSFSLFPSTPLEAQTDSSWVGLPFPFIQNYFGVDSVFYVGYSYYKDHSTAPYIDSLFGFQWAESLDPEFPNLSYDQNRYPFVTNFVSTWPAATPPSVSTFKVNSFGKTTHLYRSTNPSGSVNEGQAVGVSTITSESRTFLYGFHLWYMQTADARSLIDKILADSTQTDVNENPTPRPTTFQLDQNYPNPFNPSTTITYSLPKSTHVTLEVFNLLGQRVKILTNTNKPAGIYKEIWNGCDNFGKTVSSGVYFYRINTTLGSFTRKMMLIK
jgi:hypothetical protein